MCCVMPPASVEAIWLLLRLSSRVVFPWSTWPMMVTTGGRGTSRAGSADLEEVREPGHPPGEWWGSSRPRPPPYLRTASLLGLSLVSLTLAHLNFIPDRVTASLIHCSSNMDSGSRESRSRSVFSKASNTWSDRHKARVSCEPLLC